MSDKSIGELKVEAAQLLIEAAKLQANELDYSFELALGDVLGSIVYHIDASFCVSSETNEIRPTETEDFLLDFQTLVNSYVKQAKASRISKK